MEIYFYLNKIDFILKLVTTINFKNFLTKIFINEFVEIYQL